jgi:hypothetical protein
MSRQQLPNPYRTNPFGNQYGPLTSEFNAKLVDAIAKEYPEPINQQDPYRLKSSAWTQDVGKMPTIDDVDINSVIKEMKTGGSRRPRRTRKSKRLRKSRKSSKSRKSRKSRK